jgi:hypothetical protein
MFKSINPNHVSIRPFKAFKLWSLNQSSNGIVVYRGEYVTGSHFNSGSEALSNTIPKRSVFDGTNQMYYKDQSPFSMFGQVDQFEDNVRTIYNYCNVVSIPTRYFGEGMLSGSISITDDVTGRTYVDDGKGNLIDNATQSVQVGNVIYPHGLVISTNTSSLYSESFSGNFALGFRSSITIYENEIFIEIGEDEYNVSQNPSSYITDTGSAFCGYIRKTGYHTIPDSGEVYYDKNYTSSLSSSVGGGFGDYEYSSSVDPTGSYLAPAITTIGLYDDDLNCVAVAKLTKPIKSLPDYPVNFIIRFDT